MGKKASPPKKTKCFLQSIQPFRVVPVSSGRKSFPMNFQNPSSLSPQSLKGTIFNEWHVAICCQHVRTMGIEITIPISYVSKHSIHQVLTTVDWRMLIRSIAIDHAYKMLPSVGSIMFLHCDTVLNHSKTFISSEVPAVFHGKKREKAFTILIFIVFVVIILIFSRASQKAHQGPKIRSAIWYMSPVAIRHSW